MEIISDNYSHLLDTLSFTFKNSNSTNHKYTDKKKKDNPRNKKKTRQPNSLSRAAGIRCAFNHHLITHSIKRKCNQVGMVGGRLFSMVEKDKKEN